MSNKHDELEARLGGALREIGEHARSSQNEREAASEPASHGRGRAVGWLKPVMAAAAVAAIVGAAGVALTGQFKDAPEPSENPMVNGPAEPGGTPPPSGASTPASGSHAAVDQTAAQASSHHDEQGFGKVTVDYETATVTVLWKGEPPADVAELEGAQSNGVTVILRQSAYGQAQLEAAARRLVDAPADQVGDANITAAMPNSDRSGLVVEILKPWNGSTTSLEKLAEVPVTVRLVNEAVNPAIY